MFHVLYKELHTQHKFSPLSTITKDNAYDKFQGINDAQSNDLILFFIFYNYYYKNEYLKKFYLQRNYSKILNLSTN